MRQRGFLRVAKIVQYRARRAYRQWTLTQSTALQREQPEVLPQRAVAILESENPLIQLGAQRWKTGDRRPGENFACLQRLDRGIHVLRVQLSDSKLPGGNVDVGQAGTRPVASHRRQKAVLVRP